MMDGENMWPAISGDAEPRGHLVTAHSEMTAAWQDDWLYLHNGKSNSAALYDLAEDVHRKLDVADRFPQVRDDLKAKLEAAAG